MREVAPSLGKRSRLAFTLPDFEADTMEPGRLREHAGLEVHFIGCLRGSDALAASIAGGASPVFPEATPQ
jgi:hypothetical protein